MAVLLAGTWLGGCVTPRHIEGLEGQVAEIRNQNDDTQDLLRGIDTMIVQESNDNRRLRADMQATIDQLDAQISNLRENYNDLLQRIDALYLALESRRLGSSPGAYTEPGTPGAVTKPDQPPSQTQPDVECGTTYDDAFVLVRRAEYEQAIARFESFLTNCPEHELVENAYYWIGESFYSLGKYPEAVEKLQYLINNFKSSPNMSRALYKLGRSQEEMDKKGDAKQIFQRLIDDFPGTLEAERAKERLKVL